MYNPRHRLNREAEEFPENTIKPEGKGEPEWRANQLSGLTKLKNRK
jgi:hypothetical protein